MITNPSWVAVSSSNIVFVRRADQPYLMLGIRGQPAASIPELGQFSLIGGFNTVRPWDASFDEVADAHFEQMLGLNRSHAQRFGSQMFCEFPIEAGALKIDGQYVLIKRMAVMRSVGLSEEAYERITPQGKISGVQLFTLEQFRELAQSKECSFPYQAPMVADAFWRFGCAHY
jgi:hypothetical protein